MNLLQLMVMTQKSWDSDLKGFSSKEYALIVEAIAQSPLLKAFLRYHAPEHFKTLWIRALSQARIQEMRLERDPQGIEDIIFDAQRTKTKTWLQDREFFSDPIEPSVLDAQHTLFRDWLTQNHSLSEAECAQWTQSMTEILECAQQGDSGGMYVVAAMRWMSQESNLSERLENQNQLFIALFEAIKRYEGCFDDESPWVESRSLYALEEPVLDFMNGVRLICEPEEWSSLSSEEQYVGVAIDPFLTRNHRGVFASDWMQGLYIKAAYPSATIEPKHVKRLHLQGRETDAYKIAQEAYIQAILLERQKPLTEASKSAFERVKKHVFFSWGSDVPEPTETVSQDDEQTIALRCALQEEFFASYQLFQAMECYDHDELEMVLPIALQALELEAIETDAWMVRIPQGASTLTQEDVLARLSALTGFHEDYLRYLYGSLTASYNGDDVFAAMPGRGAPSFFLSTWNDTLFTQRLRGTQEVIEEAGRALCFEKPAEALHSVMQETLWAYIVEQSQHMTESRAVLLGSDRDLLHCIDEIENRSALQGIAFRCAEQGYWLTLMGLLKKHPDFIQAIDRHGDRAMLLHKACRDGHARIVQQLLDHGSDPNSPMYHGGTALLIASYHGYGEIVDILLAGHADVNITDKYGNTPLLQAVRQGHSSIVQTLLAAKADMHATNHHDNFSALLQACRHGFTDIAIALLEAGAHPNVKPAYDGSTPLLAACFSQNIEIASKLLESGADVNVHNAVDGHTPLSYACFHGNVDLVEYLVRAGAEVNAQDYHGTSALLWACLYQHWHLVPMLLAEGALINIQNKQGCTPLLQACRYGDLAIVQRLLESGASVNVQSQKGQTPLLEACARGQLAIVQALLLAGAYVCQANHEGATPVLQASMEGHTDIVEALLEAGADIEERSIMQLWSFHRTPDVFSGILEHSKRRYALNPTWTDCFQCMHIRALTLPQYGWTNMSAFWDLWRDLNQRTRMVEAAPVVSVQPNLECASIDTGDMKVVDLDFDFDECGDDALPGVLMKESKNVTFSDRASHNLHDGPLASSLPLKVRRS